jgi:hypothetical protein
MRPHLRTEVAAFAAALGLLLVTHLPFLDLPFYWDELGQFIPASLDLFQHGWWIPRSTLPNSHPPGVMAYLAAVWSLFGYSIQVTRVAMLVAAAAGVVATWRLAQVLLGEEAKGAWLAPAFLLASPWFWSQAVMAQLDMPAMVLTCAVLNAFLRERMPAAVLLSVLLVLVKETSVVVPAVLLLWLAAERRWKVACWFLAPFVALAVWVAALYLRTGHLLGNAEFAAYNAAYSLHPVRLAASILRRGYQLFAASGHWIATAAIVAGWTSGRCFRTRAWAVAGTAALAQAAAVTIFGGAALERYLLPVLPILYAAAAQAMSVLPGRRWTLAPPLLCGWLVACWFINPPYPFPFENNLAWTDFVRLEQSAARSLETRVPGQKVRTAWPLTDALRRPEFGFVSHGLQVEEMRGFEPANVSATPPNRTVVLYCRMWDPPFSVLKLPGIEGFLARFYDFAPPVTALGPANRYDLVPLDRFERRGQWIEICLRTSK